jgi:hypothetical protein
MRRRRIVAGSLLTGICAASLAISISACSGAVPTGHVSVSTAKVKPTRVESLTLTSLRFPGRALEDPQAVASEGNFLWVTCSNSVTEINARTGALVRVLSAKKYRFSGGPGAIAANSTGVWVVNGSGSITQVNPRTGALVRVISGHRFGFNSPVGIAITGNRLWVANAGSVTEINAITGALIQVISGPRYQLNGPSSIAANATSVWVADENGNAVTEINAATGTLIRVISAAPYRLNTPTTITVSGDRVWVGTYNGVNGNTYATEINAITGALVRVIPVPDVPFGIAIVKGNVWVMTNCAGKGCDGAGPSGAITEYNASTGRVQRSYTGNPFAGGSPGGGLTSDGSSVWVVNSNFNTSTGWAAEFNGVTGSLVRLIYS